MREPPPPQGAAAAIHAATIRAMVKATSRAPTRRRAPSDSRTLPGAAAKGATPTGPQAKPTEPKRPEPTRTEPTRPESADPREVSRRLARAIPQPECELDHASPWQLLIATILSAQSTDRMVNEVTKELFARHPTPASLAAASQDEIEGLVKRTGFFRNKAKAIRETSRRIAEAHRGEVPRDAAVLVTFPGVARKTANVVLGTAFGIANGVTVDTHAGRLSRRLGLTAHEDPVKVERDLMAAFPQHEWIDLGHRLVLHGRYVCHARKPTCARCPLAERCPSAADSPAGPWTVRADHEADIVRRRDLVAAREA
jgi:endonuclease-3